MVKKYEVKVTLKGFEKTIIRTFSINDNVKISDFCEVIIISMNGHLEHLYSLKYRNKYYICNHMDKDDCDEIQMNSIRINKLLLEKNDKLELNYDFGDNWIFKITVRKILDGHNDKNFILLDGVGKGIEEDCGGIWGLFDLINNVDNDFDYDINEFSVQKVNDYLDSYYNKHG